MIENGVSLALVVSDNFKSNIESGKYGTIYQYYIYQPSGMISGTMSTTMATYLINAMETDLSYKIIGSSAERQEVAFKLAPIDGSSTYTYIKGELYSDVTPSQISDALTGQTMMIPMIIMIIIMMVGSIVISSMGTEKENKTLETLLTLPIKRTTIVTGKIIAAAVVGLVFGMAYMLGMGFYIGSISSIATTSSGSSINLYDYGLGLGMHDYILIMVSMFLAIACALGICMILGAFAKNYKSAQTMTMPLSILAIIPMFITMFSGWYGSNSIIQTVLFVIPFSHPMMATEALMNGDITLVLSGIAYMAVFAVVSILITVRLYKSDILITGLNQNRYIEKLTEGRKHKKN
jgi:ABC-2 type transport system permease protein